MLDTNVYISAVLFGGPPANLLALARAGIIELIVSPPILKEIVGVLRHKFGFTASQATAVVREIQSVAQTIGPTTRLTVIREDEPDNRVLECAVAGGAHFIASGDRRHLLSLKTFEGIPICTPAELLRILQGGTSSPDP